MLGLWLGSSRMTRFGGGWASAFGGVIDGSFFWGGAWLTERSEWRDAVLVLVWKLDRISASSAVAVARMIWRAWSPWVARMTWS